MHILNDLLDVFEIKYQPAVNIVESDVLLSSHDVLNLFNSIAKIEMNELYEGLKERGFTTTLVENHFLWMVKEKPL